MRWKRTVCFVLAAGVLLTLVLSGCRFLADERADVVVVSVSNVPVYAAEAGGEVMLNADESALRPRWDSFAFQADAWPLTVTVYGDLMCRNELAHCTIPEAPNEGGRWYVIVRDGESGVVLEVSSRWPGEK